MMTKTLTRMTQEKEDLGGGTNDHGSVNVVGAASIPGAATPDRGLVRSGAEAFLPRFSGSPALAEGGGWQISSS